MEILEPLTERLFQNLEELSPGYEGLYQSFKAINSPFFTIHRQRLFLQNRIQLSDLKTSADKKLTLLLNQEKLFHNHRFRTALQVSSVLQSHSGSPIRLSIPETTPIIRQFKQIFHHILDKSLFIPIPTIAETTLRSQTTFFLKPDTILLTPRATVFDLMAVYKHHLQF